MQTKKYKYKHSPFTFIKHDIIFAIYVCYINITNRKQSVAQLNVYGFLLLCDSSLYDPFPYLFQL